MFKFNSSNSITTINPANAEKLASYEFMNDSDLESIITRAHQAQDLWQKLSLVDRAQYFLNLISILEQDLASSKIYSSTITQEMGKPITFAEAEVKKCVWVVKHYLEHAAEYLKNREITTEFSKSYVTYKPLGLVLGVMPWNFPFWQVFRFAIPTMMAGNGVLVKHAEICTGTNLTINELFKKAEFPEYIFNSLVINHEQTAKVIKNNKISAVSLTGSDKAGSSIGSLAAKEIKKSVLELGGNDPYVILPDADLELAVDCCLKSRLNNNGQVCIAAKRLIVYKQNSEKFKKLLLEKLKDYIKFDNNNKQIFEDPSDSNTKLGPLAREDLRENLHDQINKSVKLGAKCLLGGYLPKEIKGFYYPVTILENISSDMPAYQEELFGPVLSIFTVDSDEQAIDLANDTPYGLSAAVFSKNIDRAQDLAENFINAGVVTVNSIVSSDPRLPFGGIKRSGFGRELSREGILEFVNVKTITVR